MFCPKSLELFKIPLEELDFDLKSKKISQTLARFKYLFYLCTAIERETLESNEDGPFVYRLVLKIFILARGVRFPHGLQKSLSKLISSFFFYIFVQRNLNQSNYEKNIRNNMPFPHGLPRSASCTSGHFDGSQ